MNPADTQVVKDEKAAEQRFQTEKSAEAKKLQALPFASGAPVAAKTAAPARPVIKRAVAEVITTWAGELTPQNAPKQEARGPLAWVRLDKVPELLALLAAEGYK